MLVSNDFSVRMMGLHAIQIPEDKLEMTNEVAESVFMKIASHQSSIDISRCCLLTSKVSKYFKSCSNLLYLDVSYTAIDGIETICENCLSLKALNLAGLDLVDKKYSALSSLYVAEIIIFRSSNINNIQVLSHLPCLRSIDLGNTTIDTIVPLNNMSRLEELLLDNTTFTQFNGSKQPFFHCLHSLSALKLLNYCGTDLVTHTKHIKTVISNDFYLEPLTRREQFFLSVINNDVPKLYDLLCSGQDINARTTSDDCTTLFTVYKQRCVTVRIQTPFVLCDHTDPQKRPNALHLSILFYSYEAMQCLLDHNCDKNMSVWFGDVSILEYDNKLIDSTPPPILTTPFSPVKQPPPVATPPQKSKYNITNTTSIDPSSVVNSNHTYTTLEFIHIVFHRNVHRITDNMQVKKILNWKSVCATYHKRLIFLYNTTHIKGRLSASELNSRSEFAVEVETEEEEVVAVAIAAGETAANLTTTDIIPVADRERSGNQIITTSNNNTPNKDNNSNKVVNKEVSSLPTLSNNTSPVAAPKQSNTITNTTTTTTANSPNITPSKVIDTPSSTDSTSKPPPKVVKSKPHYLASRPRRYTWRQHAMIKKITGPLIIITESIPMTETAPGVFVIGTASSLNIHNISNTNNNNNANSSNGKQFSGLLSSGSRDRTSSRDRGMDVVSGGSNGNKSLDNGGEGSRGGGTPLPKINNMQNNSRPNSRNGPVPATPGWVGTNTTYKIKETSLMGKKSYWLESRAKYAADKAHREAPEYGSDYEEVPDEVKEVEVEKEMSKLDINGNWLDSHKVHHDYKVGRTDFVENIRNHRVSMVELEHASDREKIAYFVHQKHELEELKREGVDVMSISVPPSRENPHGTTSQVLDFSNRLDSTSNDDSMSNASTPMASSRGGGGGMLRDLSVRDISTKDFIPVSPISSPVMMGSQSNAQLNSQQTYGQAGRPKSGEAGTFVRPNLSRMGSSSRRDLLVRAISSRKDMRDTVMNDDV